MPSSAPQAGDAPSSEEDSALADFTFADTLSRLEALVERLDSDQPPAFEEALDAYEEGTVLARECMRRLNEAELRVERLSLEE